MNHLEYDTENIYNEHRKTFEMLRDHIDLSQVAFVGGIADYLNLRGHHKMPVNDFDMVISNPLVIEPLKELIRFAHTDTLYLNETSSVFQSNYIVDDCCVHLDFFMVSSIYEQAVCTSQFLGTPVQHYDFATMREFHNNQISIFTTDVKGEAYDWKRLYKHSRKGGLYNLIALKNKKSILNTV
ncbi:MAG: hypothetical protein ABJM06_06190 [Gilvibacter sp.]